MKILYNVTVIVDPSIESEWLQWMKETHIPDVMNTGSFETYQLQKVLTEGSEGGTTFAIQYLAPNMDTLDHYQAKHAPRLQEAHNTKYAGKFGAFRTIMEVISRG